MEDILQEIHVLRLLIGHEDTGYLHPHDLRRLEQASQSIRVCLQGYRNSCPVQLVCYWATAVPSPLTSFTLLNGLLLPDNELHYQGSPYTFDLYLKFHPLRKWGLHTASVIPKCSHIIRYNGEVIRSKDLDRRRADIYDANVL